MGRGIVHPVDMLDSYHPASHPELLDWLAKDFTASDYNLRRMIRSVVLSKTYQLSSSQTEFVDPQWYSHGLTKPLTAEMLHRSWLVVFQPEDPGRWEALPVRAELVKSFPDVMADEPQATVSQGLLLTNGSLLNQLASPEHSKFIKRLNEQPDHGAALDDLFLQTLGRLPDAEEKTECLRLLQQSTDRSQMLSQLAWALVTSAEFRFNH